MVMIPAGFRDIQRQCGVWKENYDAFLDEITPREGQDTAYRALSDVLEDKRLMVSLIGESRAGKSWLMNGCVNSRIKEAYFDNRSRLPKYMTFFELELELRSAMTQGTMNQLFGRLVDIPMLAIDEIGRGKWSDFTATFFENLIIKRYGERRVTLMATNLGADEFKALFDVAILERLRTQSICLVKK